VTVRRRRLEGRGCRVGRFFGFLLWPLCFVIVGLRSEVLQFLEDAGFKVAKVCGGEEQLGDDVTMLPCMDVQLVFQCASNRLCTQGTRQKGWTFSWCFSVRQIDFALRGHGRRGGLTEKVDYLVALMMAVLGESMAPC
jgi:hypothetical protein